MTATGLWMFGWVFFYYHGAIKIRQRYDTIGTSVAVQFLPRDWLGHGSSLANLFLFIDFLFLLYRIL